MLCSQPNVNAAAHLISQYNNLPPPRPQLMEWLNSPDAFEAFLANQPGRRNYQDRQRAMSDFLVVVLSVFNTPEQEQQQ